MTSDIFIRKYLNMNIIIDDVDEDNLCYAFESSHCETSNVSHVTHTNHIKIIVNVDDIL